MDIDAALIAEGTAQLNKEIKVLEAWLAELEGESAREFANACRAQVLLRYANQSP
jgi:hypothetical protein